MNPANSETAKAQPGAGVDENSPLFFVDRSEALAAENLEPFKSRWKLAMIRLLKFSKRVGKPVNVTLIKRYLYNLRDQGKLVAESRAVFVKGV